MKHQMKLELADVKRGLAAAEAKALENNWPVTICICDAGGVLLGLLRLDGATLLSVSIAEQKAKTSVITKKPSGVYSELLKNGMDSVLALPTMPFAGGVPIVVDGEVIGAIGVSGVKADEDEQVSDAGANAILNVS